MYIRNYIQSLFTEAPKAILLFDSIEKANEIAFMLKAEWDGCNGVIINSCDEVAVNTAASLMQASWCYQGDTKAVIATLKPKELKERYARGERMFINANLRCANLQNEILSEINLSSAKLNMADFSNSDLSQANLTGADASEINLKQANLTQAQLFRTNLRKANLQRADFRGTCLNNVCLDEADLTGADFRGALLQYTNLINCNFTDAIFE